MTLVYITLVVPACSTQVCCSQSVIVKMRQLLVILPLFFLAWVCAGDRPKYIGCESSEECGKGACCVIGMGRYTIPRCEAHRDIGEGCRPSGSPVNVSLEYPDNTKVNLTGVYYLFCPCLSGLSCQHDETGSDMPRCMDGFLENHLYSDDYY